MLDSTDLQSQPWRALRVCTIIYDALHKSRADFRTSADIIKSAEIWTVRRLSELRAADSYRGFFVELQKRL